MSCDLSVSSPSFCLSFPQLYHRLSFAFFFFFNDTATTEIYTLSLHDALPIFSAAKPTSTRCPLCWPNSAKMSGLRSRRSEEHTSELQSLTNLVCRLLLEKKKKRHRRPKKKTMQRQL